MQAARPRARRSSTPRSLCALLVVAVGLAPLSTPLTPLTAQQPAAAQETLAGESPVSQQLAAKLRQPGDLTLSDTTLQQALFMISEIWQVDLIVGSDVTGTVNGRFRDAPLHEILHSILFVNGFGYRVVGDSLAIMKLDALGDLNPLFESATIRLLAAKPEDVLSGAQLFSSPQGKIQAIPSASSLLVIDLPERVQRIRRFIEQLDRSTLEMQRSGSRNGDTLQVKDYTPQYVDAESLQAAVQSVLSESGKVTVVTSENRLVVLDHPQVLATVEQLVQNLDVPRSQVRITALIYDISLEDMQKLGLNWNSAAKDRIDGSGAAQSAFQIDSLMQVPAATGDPSGVVTFMNLSRHFDLTAVIQALNSTKDSRLLADPSVMVINRESADIRIVTEIPYQQLTQTTAGGNIGTTSFREAGVTLEVTPKIALDATVQLNVKPTFSRLAGFTSGQNPQPIIDTRSAQTTVRVADRQTLVIGGLRQRTSVQDLRGIPGLQDIEKFHIGKLFRSREATVRESELVVFITPEIVACDFAPPGREQAALSSGLWHLDRIPYAEIPCSPAGECVEAEAVVPAEMQPLDMQLPPPTPDSASPEYSPSASRPPRPASSRRTWQDSIDLEPARSNFTTAIYRLPPVDNERDWEQPAVDVARRPNSQRR